MTQHPSPTNLMTCTMTNPTPATHSPARRGAAATVNATACLLVWACSTALAQTPAAPHAHQHSTVSSAPAVADSTELSQGEVVRWDPRTRKVTLRHGPIKNLDMPPMTMVFVVKDGIDTTAVRPGVSLKFRATQQQGSYQVTHIETQP